MFNLRALNLWLSVAFGWLLCILTPPCFAQAPGDLDVNVNDLAERHPAHRPKPE